ncbi:ABC transporter ATP-binding protein [Embleya sp. NPDC020886]|uniref:ABC transporter ATP-binding protein n=1 Tax=Embleya sp. NPDC020886 TaxID=3363980 RepID=UPI0037BA66F5
MAEETRQPYSARPLRRRVRGERRRAADDAARAAGEDTAATLFGGSLTPAWSGAQRWRRASELSFLGTLRRLPRLVGRSFRLGWQADRAALIVVVVAEIGQGLTAAFGLLATNRILLELFAAGPTPDRVRSAAPALLTVAILGCVGALLRAGSTAATGRLEPKVERAAEVELLERVIRVEMTRIEDPEFKKLLSTARYGTNASRQMITYGVQVVNALVSLVAVGAVLAVLHPLLLPLLVLIIVPQGWGTVHSARRRYRSVLAWTNHSRQQTEIAYSLSHHGTGQEIRVHGAGAYLLHHYRVMARCSEAEQTRLARADATTDLLTSGLSGVASAITYATLAWLVLNGHAGLATSGTAVLAIRTGTTNLAALVRAINNLYAQALWLNDLEQVCAIADAHAIPDTGAALGPPTTIEVRNVSFTYPGRDRPALEDVTLTLPRGKVIALAGENGSGKSTLAKILAGLYLPCAGHVLWDGVDIREADRTAWFEHIGLVQQDFARWDLTARANVVMGRPDIAAGPDPVLFQQASDYAQAHKVTDELPRGWDTLLDRTYDGGVELSGGQWQRLALARARFRNAHVVVFDEPTAALDAHAEHEAFTRMRELVRDGVTVVLITHRLASVRRADHIHVLDRGRVAESGTHEELMAAEGRYAGMYRIQADQYRQDHPKAEPPS